MFRLRTVTCGTASRYRYAQSESVKCHWVATAARILTPGLCNAHIFPLAPLNPRHTARRATRRMSTHRCRFSAVRVVHDWWQIGVNRGAAVSFPPPVMRYQLDGESANRTPRRRPLRGVEASTELRLLPDFGQICKSRALVRTEPGSVRTVPTRCQGDRSDCATGQPALGGVSTALPRTVPHALRPDMRRGALGVSNLVQTEAGSV